MSKEQFDHAIRAAAAVVGVSEIIVLESQTIHASFESDISDNAMRSVKAGIVIPETGKEPKQTSSTLRSVKRRYFTRRLAFSRKES